MQADTDKVWRGLCEFIAEFGYAPAQRELAPRLFFGVTMVGKQLAILEARGIVELYGARRAVKLLKWHPEVPGAMPAGPTLPACAGCTCKGGACDLAAVREKLAAALALVDGALGQEKV